MITLNDVKNNRDFSALIDRANFNLEKMGYTEHGIRHVGYVSKTTANILKETGCDARTVELGAIAGWIHDIGNAVNRLNHGLTGAVMSMACLEKMGMDMREISLIIAAIGNHEEQSGIPVNEIGAALILADKSDTHRSRVRRKNCNLNDIHDRVNMSIKKNYLTVDNDTKTIRLVIIMNAEMSSIMDYFEIYLSRMILCEKAAKKIYDICRKGKKAVYIVGGKYKFFRLAQRLTTDTAFLSLTSHFAS